MGFVSPAMLLPTSRWVRCRLSGVWSPLQSKALLAAESVVSGLVAPVWSAASSILDRPRPIVSFGFVGVVIVDRFSGDGLGCRGVVVVGADGAHGQHPFV